MNIKYTIRRCDTLEKVAARFGINVQQLLAANPQIWTEPVIRSCVTNTTDSADTTSSRNRYSLGVASGGNSTHHYTAYNNAGYVYTNRRGGNCSGK